MRIKTIIGETDQHCVWKAIVDVFERQNNKWFSKESTFFPDLGQEHNYFTN